MNTMGISTDPSLLDVELPRSLIESPSVSTFLPEEEASICPLLSTANGSTPSPLTFSHPLNPSCVDDDCNNVANLCNDDTKADASSSGSSSGIGMDVPDSTTATLFNKHLYQHLQHNGKNGNVQDGNNHNGNGSLTASSKDTTPPFVSWNWPLIRKCTFFIFMSSLFAMCAVVVAMIATLPKTCNPKTSWFRGSVFYEIFPASFQDSNNDGLGDLRGIGNRVDYLASMGILAVRLNSIFASPQYPEDYKNVSSLLEVAAVLGTASDVRQLADTLHARNISLILDLPLNNIVQELTQITAAPVGELALATNDSNAPLTTTAMPAAFLDESLAVQAMRKWLDLGVDGFYVKGLQNYLNNIDVLHSNIAEWRRILGTNRVLMISEQVLSTLSETEQTKLLQNIDLVDVHLDVRNGTHQIAERIKTLLSGPLKPVENGAWIHWSIGGVDKKRITGQLENSNLTLAATIMQLMLPGTPNIFYGDEIALESANDPHKEHVDTLHLHHLPTMHWFNSTQQFTARETLPWLPQSASYTFENLQIISQMIELRERSPSIYKNAICKADNVQQNTQIRRVRDDILIVERVYPRRNSFVSISNFGATAATRDLTSIYYSGREMLKKGRTEKIFFGEFHIEALQTIVVKLDK